MNNPCEYCQYNGPYASIINPCENCPNSDFQVNVGFSPAETTKTTFYMTTTTDADVKTIHMNSNENNTRDAFVTGLSTELPTADEYRKSIGCPHYYQRECLSQSIFVQSAAVECAKMKLWFLQVTLLNINISVTSAAMQNINLGEVHYEEEN